jgi:hypothetical protein
VMSDTGGRSLSLEVLHDVRIPVSSRNVEGLVMLPKLDTFGVVFEI